MERALNEMAENSVLLPDAATIERAVGALSGVCGARVVLGANVINEVHVLATPRRAPKKIIRDIESLLLVQYGYRVDYRRISLAQVAATDGPVRERVALRGVEQVRTPHGTFVAVELVDGQHPYVGTHLLHENEADAAANATIAALNALFAPAAPLAVRGVQCATDRHAARGYGVCRIQRHGVCVGQCVCGTFGRNRNRTRSVGGNGAPSCRMAADPCDPGACGDGRRMI